MILPLIFPAVMASHFNVENKIIVISGATSGIGRATAKQLAEKGARIVILARNKSKAAEFVQQLENRNAAVTEVVEADFSSLESVRIAAEYLRRNYSHIDVLINNAGTMAPAHRIVNSEGIELTMCVNYFSHFLLTGILFPLLKNAKQGRIINFSSVAHKYGHLNFDDLNYQRHYSPDRVYSDSKLCMLLFTRELHRRLPAASHVTVNALHPGIVNSKFATEYAGGVIGLFFKLFRFLFKSSSKGAETPVFLAGESLVAGHNGKYWSNNKPQRVARKFKDDKVATTLWERSEQVTQFQFDPSK